jgi:Tfp pilus assembly protein PilO
MAIGFRDLPWYIQGFFLFVLGILLVILAGMYAPGSPVQARKGELSQLNSQVKSLGDEVTKLQQYDRRHAQLEGELKALQAELDTLKGIVPEEKEQDEFIRLVEGAATSSGVAVRRLTAKPVTAKEYHVEMPFDVEIDAPYYAIQEYFAKLATLPRITNVGDLSFSGLREGRRSRYPIRPGTTVAGTFTATTFYTKGAAGPPAKQPGKP